MKRRTALFMLGLAALGAAIAALTRWPAATVDAPPARVSPAPDVDQQAQIQRLLVDDADFRNDLLFLLVASVRDRCVPAEAGLLAQMANRAGLPVLAAVSTVTALHPQLDRPIYRYIQHQADLARCGQPLQLPAASAMRIDIEHYARSFPDSYFDPGRSSVPRDFAGRSLAERAGNACNSVVYSVLPLGGLDWRCSSLRSNARNRVRGLCESELREQHGSLGGELDMAVGRGMQDAVVAAISALPQECR